MDMRKLLITVVCAGLGLVFTGGCVSTNYQGEASAANNKQQLRQKLIQKKLKSVRKSEPVNFVVEPPAQNNFPTLLPDEELQGSIIGTWECRFSMNSYSENKINGKLTTAFNLPEGQSHMKMNFSPDGKINCVMTVVQPLKQGGAPKKTELNQNGEWYVKNGELYIAFYSPENKESYGVRSITVWHNANSFDLQYDPEDYVSLCKSLVKKAKYPANLTVTNDFEYYHAQSGNTYHITKMRIDYRNGRISETKVICKMGKMTFRRVSNK